MTEMTESDAAPAPQALAPVGAGERIDVLDILRGFAVFGILTVNMSGYANPIYLDLVGSDPWPGRIDKVAWGLIDFFCLEKFYSLFSFLFGFGMAIQLGRAGVRGAAPIPLLARRLAILAVIGACHVVFLWTCDILITYALLGFVLLAFRNRSDRTLIFWAVPCLMLAIPVVVGFADNMDNSDFEGWTAAVDHAYAVYGHGTYGEALVLRVEDYIGFFFWILVFTMWGGVLGMFLLGLWAGRRRVLHDPQAHMGLIRRATWWGLGLGAAGGVAAIAGFEASESSGSMWMLAIGMMGYAIGGPALCFFYAGGIVMLAQKPVWRKRLKPLAAVGRMALTNYLLQSAICSLIFNGYGLGYFGRVGPAAGLMLTCVIFALQIPLSICWLKFFRFGPMEWLWRTLTYARVQPILR